MYFEIMSSILGKVTPQAMLEASLDLFKLFRSEFKKDKNFLGVGESNSKLSASCIISYKYATAPGIPTPSLNTRRRALWIMLSA